MKKNKTKKKDRKPIYILLVFLVVFGFFIYLLTRPSQQNIAIEQLQVCSNVSDVKQLYEQYRFELLETDEEGKKIVAPDFQKAIRDQLHSFNLSQDKIEECIEWLPPAPTSLNVIVVPDLSRRIRAIPNQIKNDSLVLETIWKAFVKYSMLRIDTKDKLIVDVTDIDQAKGQFGAVANELQFDLSEHKGKSNRLYFSPEKDIQFTQSIKSMYDSAKQEPLGADYIYYFRRYLSDRLKRPTLYDNYINKVIIITDGYLEPEDRPSDTKIFKKHRYDYRNLLYPAVRIGNVLDVISRNQLNIPKVNIDLKDTDVLVCEVFENPEGKGHDFEILKSYWTDWLTRMGAKEPVFIPREQAMISTIKRIEDFVKPNR